MNEPPEDVLREAEAAIEQEASAWEKAAEQAIRKDERREE